MQQDNEVYDLVILGGGPAGLTAGMYAMRAVLKTILVEKAVPGGQIAVTKGVENYPGFEEISGLELSDRFLGHAQSYGLPVLRDEAVIIEPGTELHAVHTGNGKVLRTHAVLIATGGNPRKLGVSGEVENLGRGVSYCAKCDGFFFRNRVVTVVGGGDTAMEEALYLNKLASKVYLVHRREAFRASRILQQRIFNSGIELVLNSTVTRICADDQAVHSVETENLLTGEKKTIQTEGVFIFIGLNPNNRILPSGVTMDNAGYAITDDKCATNIPGVFIAGDLRKKYARQIVIAAAEGCIAALAAAAYVETKNNSVD